MMGEDCSPMTPFIMNECLEGMRVCGGSFINNLLIGALHPFCITFSSF